jgi:hypothetical protein
VQNKKKHFKIISNIFNPDLQKYPTQVSSQEGTDKTKKKKIKNEVENKKEESNSLP